MSKPRRRDTTLTIRLTKAEKERIERNAKRAGRSITDYLVMPARFGHTTSKI